MTAKIDKATVAYRIEFARRLRMIVAAHDLKPPSVARMVGVCNATMYDWMHGFSLPNAYAVAKIAKALGVDANELLGIRRGNNER